MTPTSLLRGALPFRRFEFEIPQGHVEFIFDALNALVASRSLLFANYIRHRGHFVGEVTFPRFCIRRFVRDFYVPLINGEVRSRNGHSVLRLRFRSFDMVAPCVIAAIAVGMMRRDVSFGVVFVLAAVIVHARGCYIFRREVAEFLARLELRK